MAANVAVSMGSVGDCFDHAMAESFFATLECELLRRKPPASTSRALGTARASRISSSSPAIQSSSNFTPPLPRPPGSVG